jgi:perosamine synthetase
MIPVCRPSVSEFEQKQMQKVLGDKCLAGGPYLEEFENRIAKFCGRKYAVGVSNGTSALVLAVAALNLPEKSKIIVPSFTMIAILHAVRANGHVPVFVDVDESTWNVTYESMAALVKQKDIKAAVLVETYSSAPQMTKLCKLLQDHKIPVIEDAAEGFGGSEQGKKFGSFGDMSALSFYANKLITTGEGGMILTDDKAHFDRLRDLRNHCFDKERLFLHASLSGNHRLTNLQAGIGIAQFEQLQTFYNHRKRLYQIYTEELKGMEAYFQFQSIPSDIVSSYWVFPILLNFSARLTAAEIGKKMSDAGVETRRFFHPLDRQPCYKPEKPPVSKIGLSLWERGLYLPMGNAITASEVKKSADTLKSVLTGAQQRIAA